MNRVDLLKENGVNISKYFSFFLDRSQLPPGAVIEINVKDANGKSVYSETESGKLELAKTSQFFNKIMMDGTIFNPYIHRRWIAAQFLQMMKTDLNVDKQIKQKYSYMYSLEYTMKELNRIVYCMDDEAFRERRMFFKSNTIKHIFLNYIKDALEYVSNHHPGTRVKWRKKHRFYRYDQLIPIFTTAKAELARTYLGSNDRRDFETIKSIMKDVPLIDFFENSKKMDAVFFDAFKKSGAFYTFQQLVLFEGCVYFRMNDAEKIMAEMRRKLEYEPTYVIYAILKEMIKANKYQL